MKYKISSKDPGTKIRSTSKCEIYQKTYILAQRLGQHQITKYKI